MTDTTPREPLIRRLGEDGFLVEFDERLSMEVNSAAIAFGASLDRDTPGGVWEVATALKSVAVRFDPETVRHEDMSETLRMRLQSRDWLAEGLPGGRTLWRIPSAFGAAFGPQLEEFADLAGHRPGALIDELSQQKLRVLTMGFGPGQPYLGQLPGHWDVPRQSSLTPEVPASAITAAIRQIVVFSVAAQTGWRWIGTAGMKLFARGTGEPFPLRAGDEIVFDPVSHTDFDALWARVQNGEVVASRGGALMSAVGLCIDQIGPGASLQDLGRPGLTRFGVSPGGAMDPLALYEGAALLGDAVETAVLEMPGVGGTFTVEGGPLAIALTGAPMLASADGAPLVWNASHTVYPGQVIKIGAARIGTFGYLRIAGGIDAQPELGSRSRHFGAGIGPELHTGDTLRPLEPNVAARETPSLSLDTEARFSGGEVRIIESAQTGLFDEDTRVRLETTPFRKSPRASRRGVQLDYDGIPFAAEGQLGIVSDFIVPGDIQIVGAGDPFILLPECQTTGGYPRIGTVISADLVKVIQASPGTELRLRFVTLEEALTIRAADTVRRKTLKARVKPLIRDPHSIPDLLSYRLVDGVISAKEPT